MVYLIKQPVALLTVIVILLFPLTANTHPHNWISLQTEFTVNNKGQLTDILQHWKFDIYYSAIRLDEIKNNYPEKQTGLASIAKEMAKNLKNFDYFSELTIDNTQIDLPKPKNTSLKTVTEQAQELMVLTMAFKLKKPKPVTAKTLSWRVFDPTYYIDMKHHKASQILIKHADNVNCAMDFKTPEPSPEMVRYAASLDRTQKDIQGLGDYFAENVLINCT